MEQKYYLRNIIGEYLTELGQKNDKVICINADLMGTCRNKGFVEKFPDRSFNVGIAEQNLVSFAAGFAHEGFKPYVFSMAQFITMRACEQVRTDVAYGNVDVKLIGTYSGVSGGISGATHWTIEDIGIITAMPNMIVMEPCDPVQAKRMMDATLEINTPVYIRNSVEPVTSVYNDDYKYEIGKASLPKDGNDGAFIVSGITVKYALEAARKLADEGINVKVIDMHTVKPFDKDAIIEAAKTGTIVVAEDHNVIGGLGYHVANALVENGLSVKFANIGIQDEYTSMAHAPYLYNMYGLNAEGLYKTMKEKLKN